MFLGEPLTQLCLATRYYHSSEVYLLTRPCERPLHPPAVFIMKNHMGPDEARKLVDNEILVLKTHHNTYAPKYLTPLRRLASRHF